MNIKKSELKQIIKEEIEAVLSEDRGFIRKLFRMENPNLNKYIKAFEMAMKKISGDTMNLDADHDGAPGEQYEALIKDLDMALDALTTYQVETGYDSNKGQIARIDQIKSHAQDQRRKLQARAEEVDADNKRSSDRQRDADYETNRHRRDLNKAERERLRHAYRPQGSPSSSGGSAYDKFGQRYQDRGSAIDITRLEETIANTLKEVLEGK
jgi:hypothetical protein